MKKNQITSDEYYKLKALLRYYADHVMTTTMQLRPESHPITLLEETEKASMANARSGLKTAIHDIVDMTNNWRPSRVAEFDAELRNQGAITLTEARQRYSRKYQRILKRGRIVSEEECYLIKGILDGGNMESGMPEELNLRLMLAEYEKMIKPG